MRALVVSDIHSNLEALEAVLDDAVVRGGFDVVWCLGDTVGYGPDPGPCLERLRGFELVAVAGNHDYAAVGKFDPDEFNGAARAAILWTADQLGPYEVEWLTALPTVAQQTPFTLVHGTLREPVIEYLLDREAAIATLLRMTTTYCLVGHSHYPFVCQENGGAPVFVEFPELQPLSLGAERWIVNPGSVGQPRDRDPRPSYAVFDSDIGTIERRRVEYDIATTQRKMHAAGLPPYLAERLETGT